MPDHRFPSSSTPEERFDQWLDALNQPGIASPATPEEIADVAGLARRYHDALSMTYAGTQQRTHMERNGSMTPHALSNTVPVTISSPVSHHEPRTGWFSGGWTTAVMIALVVALAGGGFILQSGWNGIGDGSPERLGLMAPGTATPETGALACGSPGYVPIVEGELNEETLASIGVDEVPLHVDGDTLRIPTSSGDVVDLPITWTPLPGSSLWTDVRAPEQPSTATVLDVETGNEWTFPTTSSFFPPVFDNPYLVVPESHDARDWRIIDTLTGEERLISDLRGEPFGHRMTVDRLWLDWYERENADTTIWVFTPAYDTITNRHDALETVGPNVLIIGDSLADAEFLPLTADIASFYDAVYASSTGTLAYPTRTDAGPAIELLDLRSGDDITVEDERFTADVLPLMYSDDGSTLIVDQPGALFSISLEGDEPDVAVLHEGDGVVPIAFNRETSTIVVKYADEHIALLNAATGDVIDMPDVTERQMLAFDGFSPVRSSDERRILTLFDEDTGTARFVNLLTQAASEPVAVLNPAEDTLDAPMEFGYYMYIEFPYVEWSDAYGYIDASGIFHAVSMDDEELWTMPVPDDLVVGEDQVVELRLVPDERCIVLNVVDSSDPAEVTLVREREPGRVTTWLAPLEPGASWTKLDIAITGWWAMPESSNSTILPAPEVVTPGATPEG